MGTWFDLEGNKEQAFKLPYYRSVNCPAYESDGNCEYYGYGYIESGWEGSLCRHPQAKGNKGGWLIQCPLTEKADELVR